MRRRSWVQSHIRAYFNLPKKSASGAPTHSALMSTPTLHLVEGKAAREELATALICRRSIRNGLPLTLPAATAPDPDLRPRSHRPCDQVATYVRPVEQPNRRGSQINRATSRGGRWQSHNQNQSQFLVAAISDRMRSHTGLTQSYDRRPISCGRSCTIVSDQGTLQSYVKLHDITTGRTTSRPVGI